MGSAGGDLFARKVHCRSFLQGSNAAGKALSGESAVSSDLVSVLREPMQLVDMLVERPLMSLPIDRTKDVGQFLGQLWDSLSTRLDAAFRKHVDAARQDALLQMQAKRNILPAMRSALDEAAAKVKEAPGADAMPGSLVFDWEDLKRHGVLGAAGKKEEERAKVGGVDKEKARAAAGSGGEAPAGGGSGGLEGIDADELAVCNQLRVMNLRLAMVMQQAMAQLNAARGGQVDAGMLLRVMFEQLPSAIGTIASFCGVPISVFKAQWERAAADGDGSEALKTCRLQLYDILALKQKQLQATVIPLADKMIAEFPILDKLEADFKGMEKAVRVSCSLLAFGLFLGKNEAMPMEAMLDVDHDTFARVSDGVLMKVREVIGGTCEACGLPSDVVAKVWRRLSRAREMEPAEAAGESIGSVPGAGEDSKAAAGAGSGRPDSDKDQEGPDFPGKQTLLLLRE